LETGGVYIPSKTSAPFFLISRGPETDMFSRALSNHDNDFFGVKRIVPESGREGSRVRWSGTRLWLRQFRGLWCFRRRASSSRVSSFDLGGYSALTMVFFSWSRASSSSVLAGVGFLLLRCSRQFCGALLFIKNHVI
jgi:hypothetical protein